MKKMNITNWFFIFAMFGSLLLTSCYDDYVDDYDSSVYFSAQKPLRTIIADRNMSIKVGVAISGKRSVDMSDWATFEIDESLLAGTGLELLPESYYTLSSPDMMKVRDKAVAIADVTVSFTDAFYSDSLSMTKHYAIPFKLLETNCDQVNADKMNSIVAVKYVSTYAGTYYAQGTVETLDEFGQVAVTDTYSTTDLSKNIIREVSTVDVNHLIRQGVGNNPISTSTESVALSIEGDQVTVSTVSTIANAIDIIDGSGTYDIDAHSMKLTYSYVKDGVTYRVNETLTLRQDILLDLRFEEWG